MKTIHASEEQIQAYAFDLENCEKSIIGHINGCGHCKDLVNEYSALFEAIKGISDPGLDFNLSNRVVAEIYRKGLNYQQDYNKKSAQWLMILGALIIGLHLVKSDVLNFIEVENSTVYFMAIIGLFIAVLWSLSLFQTFRRKMAILNHT